MMRSYRFFSLSALMALLLCVGMPSLVLAAAAKKEEPAKAEGHAAAKDEKAAEGGHEAPAKEGEHGAKGEGEPNLEEHVPSMANERSYSPAELEVLESLEERRVSLDRRTQALELREKLVDMLEERLAGRVGELNALKADLERIMQSASGEDESKLRQLASVYGAMKPDAAATVLNRVDNMLVHDILVRMPAKRAGKLMEALDPVKARKLSELMAQKTPLPVVSDTVPAATTPAQPAAL